MDGRSSNSNKTIRSLDAKVSRRSLLSGFCAAGASLYLPGATLGAATQGSTALSGGLSPSSFQLGSSPFCYNGQSLSLSPSAHAIIPVVRFGKWVWKDQPEDKTGYVDPRKYEVSVGIEWTGTGSASGLQGATVSPAELNEQTIDSVEIEKSEGCDAQVRKLTDEVSQFEIVAPSIERGQVIRARVVYQMTLYRNCNGLSQESFPFEQEYPREITKAYLGNSPGIEAGSSMVSKLLSEIATPELHPWQKAKIFHEWVWENIEGKHGDYTSVKDALRNRVGDCEERATVFIALCRAAKIPARLVWVPSHAWAEFCLTDKSGKQHWIPSHTAAYPWFGWTGAHELVFQKGDKIEVPQEKKPLRLVRDWMRWEGAKPQFRFAAYVKPLGEQSSADAGPGGRIKLDDGKWGFLGEHPENEYMRE